MRFSRRLPDLAGLEVSELERLRRARGGDVLDLSLTSPLRAGLLEEDLCRCFSEADVRRYAPRPLGGDEAREAVAEVYRSQGLDLSAARVALTASTSEAYGWALKLLCDPGDEVLTPSPSYPLFDSLVALEGVKQVSYPLIREDRWVLDRGALEASLSARSRVVFVVSPNNPTGHYLNEGDWAWLSWLCRERGLVVVSDEVFSSYPLEAPQDRARLPLALDAQAPLVLSLDGASKRCGLAGLKLGWVIFGGDEAVVQEAMLRWEHLADSYLSLSAVTDQVAPLVLKHSASVRGVISARLEENLSELRRVSRGALWDLWAVEGGWVALLRLPRVLESGVASCALLAEEGVYLHPGELYGFDPGEAVWVVSLLTPSERLGEGLAAMSRWLTHRLGEGLC